MIKFRVPTHYNHFKESDLIEYYNRCYYNEQKSFEIVNHNQYDFLILINRPIHDTSQKVSKKYTPYYKFDKKKTIIFQNEPLKKRKSWNKRSRGFINPLDKDYYHVSNIERYHSLVLPVYKFNNIIKIDDDRVVTFISAKQKYPLQLHRNRFYKRFIRKPNELFINAPSFDHDYISEYSDCGYKFKKNKVQNFFDYRYQGYLPYRYVMQSECIDEPNYFTEKIIEPIMCECLTFYSGCSNVDKFIDSRCFIRVDLSKPDEAIDIIKQSIENDEWSKRIKYIRREKIRIHKEMSFLRIAEKIISQR